MSDNPSSKKIDFIDFYIKDWLHLSEDPNYITDVSKYLLNALKLNDEEIEKLVEITSDTLHELLKQDKIKTEKINGFPLDKVTNWSTRHVEFLVKNGQIIPHYYSKDSSVI